MHSMLNKGNDRPGNVAIDEEIEALSFEIAVPAPSPMHFRILA